MIQVSIPLFLVNNLCMHSYFILLFNYKLCHDKFIIILIG